MKKLIYLLSLFLLPGVLPLRAQVKGGLPLKRVPVNTINYEQGLLYNETAAIITDTLGFTWLSTSIGLQRYNGYILQNIDPVVGRDTVKIRTRVYFCRLQNGNLWISCKKGILEYNPFTNVFKNIITINCTGDEVFEIIPLRETPDGIWCLKKGLGMVIYDQNGKLKKIVPSVNTSILDRVINSDYIRSQSIISSNPTHIFIRTAINTLLDYNTFNLRVNRLQIREQIMGVGCSADFLYVSTPHNIEKRRISDAKLFCSYSLQNITRQPVEACGVYYIPRNRVIVSVNDQVIELDADLKNPRLLSTFSGLPLVVSGRVEHIYRDAFDRLWLLTNDDIKRIQDKEIPFSYLKYPDLHNFVRCVYIDEQTGQLLAGCMGSGLQVYNKLGEPLWHAQLQANKVKNILAIDKLGKNAYLIITWNQGWYLLDLLKRKLKAFNFSAGQQFKSRVYSNAFSSNIQRINDSTLLVAAVSNVFRCVFQGQRVRSVKPMLPFFKTIDNRISCAHLASDGTMWVGIYQGAVYRMEKNGLVKSIDLPEKFSARCFAEDASHHIWIGTSGGLYACTLTGRVLKSFYKRSGLLNDCIYSLLPLPANSSVIASSNMGLSNISLNGNINNYTKELGLQDNEFNTAAAVVSASGKFYFGGINGITAFYPSSLNQPQSRPTLNMTKLVVNDSSYNSSGLWKGDTIKLKYNQNHLLFDFAAMGPLNADKYFYRYRLKGFENHWQSTHQPVNIRYILQPGNYTLEIACSSELSGAEVKRNILVVIAPPFWLRWWFFMVIVCFATSTVVFIVSFYNKRKYQNALQELMLNQRLQGQRERISRDLHDNLGAQANAIYYGTELLKKKNGAEQKMVESLHDTARDMLTVLRETLWALKITQVEAADLWLRVLNFARKIGPYYPEVKLAIKGNAPAKLSINAPKALNMVLIIQEAINNAVRHSAAAVVSINSNTDDDCWRIEIIDDGKGFELLAVSKKTENYGLENMAARAKESNIRFEINTVPLHGTTVLIEVSLSRAE